MIVSGNLEKKVEGFVGIDPGATGAIAIMHSDRVVRVIDMPMHDVVVGKEKRSTVDFVKVIEVLTPYINQNHLFIVEMTPVFVTMSGGSSSSANWNLGYSQGFLTSFFLIKGASFRLVRSQEWHKLYDYKNIDYSALEIFKKQAEISPSKEKRKMLGRVVTERKKILKQYSLTQATKIAPHIELVKKGKIFKTGKATSDKIFDGRCEAILISNYGRCTNGKWN